MDAWESRIRLAFELDRGFLMDAHARGSDFPVREGTLGGDAREIGHTHRIRENDFEATQNQVATIEGGVELAQAVEKACDEPSRFEFLYPLDLPLKEKIDVLATRLYDAEGVDYEPGVKRRLAQYVDLGYGKLPICVAKTQYSLPHGPKLLGRPRGFRFPIRDVRVSAGAGFLYALADEITTMPGLPSRPAAERIDADVEGRITGIS